ncbi:nuclear transport factor 2 family protein [Primorskyibacter sp. S187A]|uniref:nuclear transport factor 2 family protein n=1 Tax=Primorskyibacter sp. S187A TaxID=3415130 RepID=UPI003C7C0711
MKAHLRNTFEPARAPFELPSPQTAEMLHVMKRIFQEIWIDEHDECFDELYHPDVEVQGIDHGSSVGLEDFKDLVREFRRHQIMRDFKIIDVISDDHSRCAIWIDYKVHVKAAEADATLSVACNYTITDGKVKHVRVLMERLAVLEEIHAIPDGAYFIGLSGGRFA